MGQLADNQLVGPFSPLLSIENLGKILQSDDLDFREFYLFQNPK